MKNNFAIGIDIGGSHICCAAFDLVEKKLLEHTFAESKLDNHAAAHIIFSCWAKTIQTTIDKVGKENVVGLGFAMPGPFDYEKGIPLFTGDNNKYENIFGLNVRETLIQLLGLPDEFPIRFMNDATAFAVGEEWFGKAIGVKKLLSITLGTGIGSAFIDNSLPVPSGDNVPLNGCVWHLPFKIGIADDYFSSRGLVKRYHRNTGISIDGVKEIALAAENDEMAKEVFKEFGIDLFKFLKPWLEKFGVEKIVLGGNISLAADLFVPSIKTELAKEGLSSISIDISELGETAAIIGGARLIEPDYWLKIKEVIKDM